jgi:hypothetical protein
VSPPLVPPQHQKVRQELETYYSITYQDGKLQEQIATGPITPHSSPLPTHLTQTFQKLMGV